MSETRPSWAPAAPDGQPKLEPPRGAKSRPHNRRAAEIYSGAVKAKGSWTPGEPLASDTKLQEDRPERGTRAPSAKAWAGVAGGSLATNLAVVITYYLNVPWEVALAVSGVIISIASGMFYYFQPPD